MAPRQLMRQCRINLRAVLLFSNCIQFCSDEFAYSQIDHCDFAVKVDSYSASRLLDDKPNAVSYLEVFLSSLFSGRWDTKTAIFAPIVPDFGTIGTLGKATNLFYWQFLLISCRYRQVLLYQPSRICHNCRYPNRKRPLRNLRDPIS